VKQISEQGAIMKHRIAQLLDTNVSMFVLHRDIVSEAVILRHCRMID